MSDTVAKRTATVAAMVEAGAKGRALMGGTDAMRGAGETYLPKFKAEQAEDYTAKLNSSWLFNGMRKTVKDMTGRVFDKTVEIPDAPQQIKDWCENVDMQGRDLSVFAAEVFKDAFVPGISFIMVDAPRRDGETTREQAATMGLRPYLVHLRVEDILGFKTALYGNALALSQIRIFETVQEENPKDEFTQVDVEQVRVMDRMDGGVYVRIYRKSKDKEWAVFDDYVTEAGEITVIPFYAQRTGFFTGEPVLEDLADVNIAHWASQADQRNILHYFRVPILHASGRQDDGPLVISAGMAVTSSDPLSRLEWVKADPAPIVAGRTDLKDLEFQMETLGLQLLVARTGNAGATGAAIDNVKETSTLAMMADSLKDALEQALTWMAFYGGLGEQSITVQVNKDFGVIAMTPQEVLAMQKDVAMGYLSLETYMEERKRRGVLRPDLDTADEIERIETEGGGLELTDVSE